MNRTTKKSQIGRELDALSRDGNGDTADLAPPSNGELFRYSCPVDHSGHMVNMRGWRCNDDNHKPAFVLVHDVGEEISMYRNCARYICEQGFSCYGFDQRGHGESTDSLGDIISFQNLVKDLLQVVSWVRHLHDGRPPIIVGQGYGCLVASEMLVQYPNAASGIILSAPTFELSKQPSSWLRFSIKVLSDLMPNARLPKMFRPRFSNPYHRPIHQTMATRIVSGIMTGDDLKVTAGFARELLSAMARFPETFGSMRKPLLILRSEADEVARFDKITHMLTDHPEQDLIESHAIEGLHHNPFTASPDSMKVVTDITLAWVTKVKFDGKAKTAK